MSQYVQSAHSTQQTPAMPPSHPHTVGAVDERHTMRDEDEDNDICPVCDGECTCANRPGPPQTPSHILTSPISVPTGLSSSNQASVPPQKLPTLKIRLTIPPSMLGKRPASFARSRHAGSTTSASGAGGGTFNNPRPSTSFSAQHGVVPKKKRGRPPKSLATARQLGVKSAADTSPFYHSSQAPRKYKVPASNKAGVSRLPSKLKGKGTTVKKSKAAKRRRVESSESSSELSDIDDLYPFDDDSHIRSVQQLPTFVPASVLSSSESEVSSSSGFDSDSSMEAEEENFIISQEAEKARVRRELLGDNGQRSPHHWALDPRPRSTAASDAEMDVDSDATEDEEEEEEQEAEEDDDETDGLRVGSGYIGVATGWSEEDEESSFDADLFFANLTDSDDQDDDRRSCSTDEHDERGEDGDQSDLESVSLSDTALHELLPRLRRNLEHLPFELMEDWDGQVIFSNGLGDSRGLLDVDFEVDASIVETSTSPSHDSDNEDELETVEEGSGDTTDEELVGEDHLPNERAMRMFKLPFSVSSINPLSTMSPSGSPAPRSRRPFDPQSPIDAPKPADILAGRVFLEESDNPDDDFDDAPSISSKGNGPRTGTFVPGDAVRAIIDDTHADVPSPHPRARVRRRKFASQGRISPRPHVPSRQQSLPPPSQPSFQLLSSSELTTSPELPPQTIDLDDVLDTAFLDSEPSEEALSASPSDQSRKQLNLSRWGWGSDTPTADYDKVMKSSPLSLLWQDKDLVSAKPGFPKRGRDGDRTPTNATAQGQQIPQFNIPTKRKESRRERKMKQKNNMGYERPPHQQHYFRQHHPNLKSRSSSSAQRNNFFNSSPPTTNM